MNTFIQESIYIGVLITIGSYGIGIWFKKITGWTLANPLLISTILVMLFLAFSGMSYETYTQGSSMISYLLTPATICLAVPMYEQMEHLRKNSKAVVIGITTGVIASTLSILAFVVIFNLEYQDFVTLMPKSITTAIGMDLSKELGGNTPVTIMAIIITGITGNVIAEKFLKFIGVTNPVAKGIAIGSSSHVIGTSKAMEMGVTEGAMSSIAIVTSGIITVLVASIIPFI